MPRLEPPLPYPEEEIGAVLRSAQPTARRVLYRYRIPPQDAEDLLQDATLQLLRHWHTLEDPTAWFGVHLRFLCLNYWRARRRKLHEAVDDALLQNFPGSDGSSSDRAEVRLDLFNLLRRIPDRCRKVIRLRYGMGFAPAEVADQVGCRRTSVGQVTKRCVSALTRALFAGGYS